MASTSQPAPVIVPTSTINDMVGKIPIFLPKDGTWMAYKSTVFRFAQRQLDKGVPVGHLIRAVRFYGLDPALQAHIKLNNLAEALSPDNFGRLDKFLHILEEKLTGSGFAKYWQYHYAEKTQDEEETAEAYFEIKLELFLRATPEPLRDYIEFFREFVDGILNGHVRAHMREYVNYALANVDRHELNVFKDKLTTAVNRQWLLFNRGEIRHGSMMGTDRPFVSLYAPVATTSISLPEIDFFPSNPPSKSNDGAAARVSRSRDDKERLVYSNTPTFTPRTMPWSTYKRRILEFAELEEFQGLPAYVFKLAVWIYGLGPSLLVYVGSHRLPSSKSTESLEDYLKGLGEEIASSEVYTTHWHNHYRRRVQKPEETCEDFFDTKLELFKAAKPHRAEYEIKEFYESVIAGLASSGLKDMMSNFISRNANSCKDEPWVFRNAMTRFADLQWMLGLREAETTSESWTTSDMAGLRRQHNPFSNDMPRARSQPEFFAVAKALCHITE